MYRRKIAYVFRYRNGIREQSVGVLRQYGSPEAMETVLELMRGQERGESWYMYYFNCRNFLTEASYLWETSSTSPRNGISVGWYRLCAEAGKGNGVLLLPEHVGAERGTGIEWPSTDYYLCGRFDGEEVSQQQVEKAFSRTGVREEGECLQSARRLVEEIARAAEKTTVSPKSRAEYNRIACLEELLAARPSYKPCREASLLHSVRVLPEELARLPKEGRQFAENSFLLHGYYHYKHLLLGRRRKKEQEDYVLLVPGVYQKKDAYLAALFGFSEFVPAERPMTGTVGGKGGFGYWCAKI